MLFGRHAECDVQLNSRKVSRRHCCIAQIRDYLVVRDLGSTNGVRINGVRVVEGQLRSGDELTIGNFLYRVTMDQDSNILPKPAVNASMNTGPDDELLESSDEPVPIPDPDAQAKPDNPNGTLER
jgi:pSer/pThr/pTyr-binding forkhead associated (FHA) protein